MSTLKKEKKKPERNWISLSVIMIVLTAFLTFYNPIQLQDIFFPLYFSILWLLVFVYVLTNALREIPDFELRKSLLKIKKIEVYESWYFLTALGLFFASVVIVTFSNFGELVGTTFLFLLYGFLLALIRDILKSRREHS